MRPHKWAKRVKTPHMVFEPSTRVQKAETHGVYAFTGPPGSGKTLLAVHFARKYVKRKFKICPCGNCGTCKQPSNTRSRSSGCQCKPSEKTPCKIKWECFTNLESTHKTEDNPKGWAKPLDIQGVMMDRDQDINHSVLILDEAYLFADSRRAQKTSNMEMGYFIAQRRKISGSVVKAFYSVQSIDMIDRRIREQTSRVYNCWTPNDGYEIYYTLHHLAQGHLAPWQRNKMRAKPFKELTEHTKQYYDTNELVDTDEVSTRGQPTTLIIERDGQKYRITSDDAMEQVIGGFVDENTKTVKTADIVSKVKEIFNMQISNRQAKEFMQEYNYRQTDNGVFQVMG